MTVIAQISDLHLGELPRSAERARAVLRYLGGLSRPVDALVVTGDVADHGLPDEYALAAELFGDLPFPVLSCPGNHDVRGPYRAGLLGQERSDVPVNVRLDVPGLTLLAADSSIPGRDEGLLEPSTLRWLRDELAADPSTPAVVAMHHAPVPLQHPVHDGLILANPDDLRAVLADAPHVVGLLAGHAHLAAASTFAGVPLRVGPGITWSLLMPWDGEGFADFDQPPSVAFHVLDGGTPDGVRLTTHYRVVV
jgi:3',5'-cyclic AMP phosphodiesterase CpdA